MTNEKALQIAKSSNPLMRGSDGDVNEYVECIINALEKQIPKKPVYMFDGNYEPYLCPTCGAWLSEHRGDGYFVHHIEWLHCHNEECLQRIDWGDYE